MRQQAQRYGAGRLGAMRWFLSSHPLTLSLRSQEELAELPAAVDLIKRGEDFETERLSPGCLN